MTPRPRQPRVRRRGAAAAELAVVLPFVVFLLAVAVDFCRFYSHTQAVQNSAYAGALYASGAAQAKPPPSGSAAPTDAEVEAARTEAARQAAVAEGVSLRPALKADDVRVSYAHGRATVVVTYECELLTPVLGASRRKTLTREVTMRVIR